MIGWLLCWRLPLLPPVTSPPVPRRVSVIMYHRMERQYERLSAFFSVISVMGVGAASARRSAPVTGAYGPCLACRRRDYDAVGGHEAVRAAVVDDVALAQRFRAEGLPV